MHVSEVTTRLSNVSTLKAESVSISLSLHVCPWESLHQSRGDPPRVYAELISPQCVPVLCHCWQTGPIGRAGGGCSHAILRPDSGQTRHRPLTKGGGSGEAVRQLVCVSMFMEYAFTPAVNFELVLSHPNPPVAIEANNHVVSLTHLQN